jgi:hypothetical protein
MSVLDVDYMVGLVPILLRYLPLTLQMAAVGMALALVAGAALTAFWFPAGSAYSRLSAQGAGQSGVAGDEMTSLAAGQ